MTLQFSCSGQWLSFRPNRVVIAGYTGRNRAAVEKHIQELAEQGIPAPSETPTIFHVGLDRLSTASHMEVLGPHTAGEAEAVLLMDGKQIYVAIGSDHTDRELEKYDIPRSKQVCGKPISAEVWRFEDIRGRWDSLVLRSYVGENGPEILYQEGRLASIMPPEDLIAAVERRAGSLNQSALFTGTVPLIDGKFYCGGFFQAELFDEATGQALRCAYRIRQCDLPMAKAT